MKSRLLARVAGTSRVFHSQRQETIGAEAEYWVDPSSDADELTDFYLSKGNDRDPANACSFYELPRMTNVFCPSRPPGKPDLDHCLYARTGGERSNRWRTRNSMNRRAGRL